MRAPRPQLRHLLLALALVCTGSLRAADLPRNPAAPIRYVLVIDLSGSMAQERRLPMLIGSVAATLAILPDGAEVAIVSFNHEVKTVSAVVRLDDATRSQLLKAVEQLTAAGGTDILAATNRSLELSERRGGHVIVFSDGAQTGFTNVPWPETQWGPVAGNLTRAARGKGVFIHALALGLESQAEGQLLLRRLAADTGGEFFGIREPSAMLTEFVTLAASLGRYWRRSETGEFDVAAPEVVIQVVSAGSPPSLLRTVNDRWVPVDAAYEVVREELGLRIERSRLQPGHYRFRPDTGVRHSDLLRPLDVSFGLPAETSLPAGRVAEAVLQVHPLSGAELPRELKVSAEFRFDQEAPQQVVARVSPEGRARLQLTTPARLGSVQTLFTAETQGWKYRIGSWQTSLVLPPPLEIAVRGQAEGALKVRTRGDQTTVTLPLNVSCPTAGKPIDLLISSTSPLVGVTPDRVRIERPENRVELVLSRRFVASQPKVLEAALRIRAKADDLVPPRINAQSDEVTLAIQWTHERPSLALSGLERAVRGGDAPPEYTVRRGNVVSLPISLAGVDLAGDTTVGVRLDTTRAQAGFELRLRRASGPCAMLSPGGDPAELEIAVTREVLPGRYPLDFAVLSTATGVPLNGQAKPIEHAVVVEVPAVSVLVELLEGGSKPWKVLAPIEPARCTIVVGLRAADGGTLPDDICVAAHPDVPVQVVDRGRVLDERKTSLRHSFEAIIPRQTAPTSGVVRFSVVATPAFIEPVALEWRATVEPAIVRITPTTVELPRYRGWRELVFGWMRPKAIPSLTIQVEGPWEQAQCSWSVLPHQEGGAHASNFAWRNDHTTSVTLDPDDRSYRIALKAIYEHVQFEPPSPVPVLVTTVEVPVPILCWLFAGMLILVLCLIVTIPFITLFRRLRIKLATGSAVLRGLGRLSFGEETGLPEPLLLTRGLSGIRLARSKDDPGDQRVVVTSGGAQGELAPGESRTVGRGDTIEVETPTGESHVFELLSGRKPQGRFDPYDQFDGDDATSKSRDDSGVWSPAGQDNGEPSPGW